MIAREFSGWSPRGALRKAHPSIRVQPGRGRTLASSAWAKAERQPDAVAFHFEDGSCATYGEIGAEAKALCSGLQQLGLGIGDTLSFQLPNWREAIVVNIAAAALGLVANPLTPIYRGAELRHILRDARSKLIFIPDRYRSIDYAQMLQSLRSDLPDLLHLSVVRGNGGGVGANAGYGALLEMGRRKSPVFPDVEPDWVKLVLYTSGTTGRAKGVLHTHVTMEASTLSGIEAWKLGRGDVMLMPSPVTHITGYGFGLELPFLTDVAVALVDRWDAAQVVPFIDKVGATACIGATPFLKELIDEAERQNNRLASMKLFACGGASVSPDLILRASRSTERLRACRVYGATEVPLVTKGFTGDNELGLASETDGRVVGYEVKVVDAAGRALPTDREGEILVRGASMMIGYTDAEETEKAFDDEGYFRSGDIGVLTEQNAVVVTARLKDLIIRGGENLSPKEIEDALAKHPAIAEAAVVAMPHPRLGEGVCAFVSVRWGAEAPSLMDLADFLEREGLARQKFPERLEYIEDFPRTPSGKIRKDILRDALKKQLVVRLAT